MRETEEDDFELMLTALRHAAVAGGCRALARRHPDASVGLLKAAEFHTGRAQALLAVIAAGAGNTRPQTP